MKKIEYAIAKFKFSKNDLYVVEIIQKFDSYEYAYKIFVEKNYANSGGGTWQEAYNYEIIDIKENINYYHNGGKIATVFD